MTVIYGYRTDKRGKIIECDSCNLQVPTADFDWDSEARCQRFNGRKPSPPKRPLCEFCSTTLAAGHTSCQPINAWREQAYLSWKTAANVYNCLRFGPPGSTANKFVMMKPEERDNEREAAKIAYKADDLPPDQAFDLGWKAALSFVCRNTPGPCFCGGHLSVAD